jgi:hypothetical protein
MRILALVGVAAAGLLLTACEDGYYGPHYVGDGYGYSQGYGDVWYDGYYGPYSDGYWDGPSFYYSYNGGFRRDEGGHFRHERFEGSQRYRSSRHRHGQ